jgi:predicted ferric reductase
MLKTKLFDGDLQLQQQAIVSFWVFNFALILLLWLTTTTFSGGLAIMLDAIGMLCGLLATFFALTQFMLMGRINWIERQFGLDHLASYHRIYGYLAITFIMIHPIFITISYSMENHINLFRQYVDLILHYNYVWLAFIAQILFIAVVVSSIYIARKRMKFESWYFVHLAVYAAIVIVPLHQLAVGDSFAGDTHPLARIYWIGLYVFVGLNILVWRFSIPLYNLLRFDFRIAKVVAETPTTTSIYIHGRKLERWRTKPGQFVLVRFFSKKAWWQEHPFSLSMSPHDNLFRLTIRHVGDYTTDVIPSLQRGTRVLVSGPYGRFTNDVATTRKRLFIAGGIGITPLRTLLEEAVKARQDSVLIYGSRFPDDTPLSSELDKLVRHHVRLIKVYSEPPSKYRGEKGYVDLARIKRLVPDYITRDTYICGPPVMMEHLVQELSHAKVRPDQLHFERFALHN